MDSIDSFKKSSKYNLVAAHDISNKQLKRLVEKKLLNSHQVYNNFNKMLKNAFSTYNKPDGPNLLGT